MEWHSKENEGQRGEANQLSPRSTAHDPSNRKHIWRSVSEFWEPTHRIAVLSVMRPVCYGPPNALLRYRLKRRSLSTPAGEPFPRGFIN